MLGEVMVTGDSEMPQPQRVYHRHLSLLSQLLLPLLLAVLTPVRYLQTIL